jgi:hypothetical protein
MPFHTVLFLALSVLGQQSLSDQARAFDAKVSDHQAAMYQWPHRLNDKTYDQLDEHGKAVMEEAWVTWMAKNGLPALDHPPSKQPTKKELRRQPAKPRPLIPYAGGGFGGPPSHARLRQIAPGVFVFVRPKKTGELSGRSQARKPADQRTKPVPGPGGLE